MMELYGFDTINTFKVLLFLLETDAEFEFFPVNIRTGEQHKPELHVINPAGKVPVLRDGDQYQTESNAILISLAKKARWGVNDDLIAWLFSQASTQGPHFGQIEHWTKFAKTSNPDALALHRAIADRTIAHLNDALNGKDYICGGTYSIADIALFPWLHVHGNLDLSLEKAPNLAGWLARIRARPATIRAKAFFGANSIF